VDEFSAVSRRLPIWQLYERARSLGLAVQVSAQSWQDLAPDDDDRYRIAATADGGIWLLRTPHPEPVTALAGDRPAMDTSRRLLGVAWWSREGTTRERRAPVADPALIRNLGVAILGIIHHFGASSGGHHAKSSPGLTPQLSVDSAPVTSCADTSRCHKHSAPPAWRGPELADLKIRNSGNGVADITQVRVKVQRVMRLGASFPSSALVPIDGTYSIQLPSQANQSVSKDLPEMVQPNMVARFDFSFLPPHVSARVNLYRISISLVYNGGSTMSPIEMLISVPIDPPLADKCSSAHPQLCSFLRLSGSRDNRLGQLTP
jgi:hypothetical protein